MKYHRRMLMTLAGLVAGAVMTGGAASPAPANSSALRMVLVDVEGGAATLFITPEGRSLLIDTGWPAGMGGPRGGGGRGGAPGAPTPPAPAPPAPPSPSSAERIAAQLRAAGLNRLDYLLISHYHVDHMGGFQELNRLIPIGTYIDHGQNRELPANAAATPSPTSAAGLYSAYEAAIVGKPRRMMAAGDTLQIDGLTITAVTSDGQPISRALTGASGPGANCDKAVIEASNGGEENPRSLGILATFGQARILALGDSTWSTENKLVCPANLIGKVDLMKVDNHGSANANSLPLLSTVRPTVMVIDNGATKGAEAATYDTLAVTPGLANLWQVHFASRNGEARNAPADQIANIDGGPDTMHPLHISITRAGAVTLTNPRNGFSKTYPKAP